MTQTTQTAAQTADYAYANTEALSRLFEQADAALRPASAHLLLRSLLHPRLAPFRDDPLRPFRDRFISLDALRDGMVDTLRQQSLLSHLAPHFAPEDRREILPLTPELAAPAAPPSFVWPAALPGCVPGALYVPSRRAAVPCRVWAARLNAPGQGWPEPRPVRPVGEAILDSARAALRAALAALERFLPLPETLRPSLLFFDVCAPALDDVALENAAGDSLGLPLALAFLSALLDMPVAQGVGATGAVGPPPAPSGALPPAREAADAARPVNHVAEKRAALAPLGVLDFLAPDEGATHRIGSVVDAACRALVGGGLLFVGRAAAAGGEYGPDEEDAVTAFVAVLPGGPPPPAGAAWLPEARDLTRRTLEGSGGRACPPRRIPPDLSAEALLFCFPSAYQAARAALAARQTLLCHLWDRAAPATRVGLHVGVAAPAEERDDGPDVERVLLLAEAAPDGVLLTSERFRDACGVRREAESPDAGAGVPPPLAASFVGLGAARLRNLEPVAPLFRLVASDEARSASACVPRVLAPERHNLPVQSHARVGREKAVEEVLRLLRQPGARRCVTLTGQGGLGKTRLALEVAARAFFDYPDGVWFVPLAQARSPEAVASAIIAALRLPVRTTHAQARPVALKELANRRALLVLDNDEADQSGAVFLQELREAAPGVALLTTAVTRLNLREEVVYPVPPLEMTAPAPPPGRAGGVAFSEAEQFVVSRLRSAGSVPPPLDADARTALRSLCRRVGGVPLALEIAAAQAVSLSLADVDRRLEDALRAGGGGLDDEHSPLDRTLDWAYALLRRSEKRMLLLLAAFEEGWTMAAAEAVSRVGPGGKSALHTLAALEAKALVQRRPGADADRWFLLPTIQAFARSKWRQSPAADEDVEEATARELHAGYFAALAADYFPHFNGLDAGAEAACLDALDREMDNLRSAFQYFRQRDTAAVPAFVVHLSEHLRHRGHQHELLTWCRDALRIVDSGRAAAEPSVRARLHRSLLLEFVAAGQTEDAGRHLADALYWAEASGDEILLADILNVKGIFLDASKRYREAEEAYQEACARFRRLSYLRGEISSLNNLASSLLRDGRFGEARPVLAEIIGLCRRAGDRVGLLTALSNLGYLSAKTGDLTGALRCFGEATDISLEVGQVRNLGSSLLNLGDVLALLGDVEAAVSVLSHAEQLFLRVGHAHAAIAGEYLLRCAEDYGADRVALQRKAAAAKGMSALLTTDPRPVRHLDLRGAAEAAGSEADG